ncbi:hypothetical protein EVJ58_g9616, partial [Rhodofomes roseus]
ISLEHRGSLAHHPVSAQLATLPTPHSADPPSVRTPPPAEDTDGEEDYDFGAFGVILPRGAPTSGACRTSRRAPCPHTSRARPTRAERASGSCSRTGPRSSGERMSGDCARRRGLRGTCCGLRGSLVEVGVTTDSIDGQLHDYILSHSAYPSPLLYRGFPRSCCTSINNVVTHGIPRPVERPLQDGDIVNIDITVYKHGFHGDTSRTFLVGDVDEKGRELVKITEDALEAAIGVCAPGQPLNLIGKTIHELLRGTKYSVSTQFTGHGIGEDFHKSPWILHHRDERQSWSYASGPLLHDRAVHRTGFKSKSMDIP